MDNLLGSHMVRMDLIARQGFRAVKLRIQDIIRIALISRADFLPLQTGNDAHQRLQRLGDFLNGSLLIAAVLQLIDDNVLHHSISLQQRYRGWQASAPVCSLH